MAAAAAGPPKIRRLEEHVVNRIAAGEIIHRPSSALKEMLENSLDAGATTINVLTKQGGLKLLQIQDNGHGIQPDDFGILCERFTTSKLEQFDDLKKIATFGFRGEALASITHVAHLTVTSMTPGAPCAHKAHFVDGALAPLKPGDSAAPKRCAGLAGTQIAVEDLFYNMPLRRKALRSPSDEYHRIVDVMTKYAVHFAGISFTCKKHGEHAADMHTTVGSSVTENIGALYGQRVSRELLEFKVEEEKIPKELSFACEGHVSNVNFNMKKAVLILFINNRLVESTDLKKAIDAVYAPYLPKGSHPFVYLKVRSKRPPLPHVPPVFHELS
jgi:DNA mismatch repair protein MLH1